MKKEILDMDLLKLPNGTYHAYSSSKSDSSLIDGNNGVKFLGEIFVHLDEDDYPLIADENDVLEEIYQIRNKLCEYFGGNHKCGKLSALELAEKIVREKNEKV